MMGAGAGATVAVADGGGYGGKRLTAPPNPRAQLPYPHGH